MWDIKGDRPDLADVALISGEQEDLVYYDIPILFAGFNKLHNRVIGSFIDMDDSRGTENYIHAVLDTSAYSAFRNCKISYPEALRKAKQLFVACWFDATKPPNIYPIRFDDIPEDFRPKETAFAPPLVYQPSIDYPVILEGGEANWHQARPDTVKNIHEHISELLLAPSKRLQKPLKLDLSILLQADPETSRAYQPSSFRIDYKITIEQTGLFSNAHDYLAYANEYIAYCLNILPKDSSKLLDSNVEMSQPLNDVWEKYTSLLGSSLGNEETRKKEFIDDMFLIAKGLDAIAYMVGDGFESITLASGEGDAAQPLGVIDEEFKEHIEQVVVDYAEKTGKKLVKDDVPQVYRLHIYDLNTGTRKGRAFEYHEDRNKVVKPTIFISGNAPLAESKYTESLHLDKYIDVRGIATKIDGILRHVDITYEP